MKPFLDEDFLLHGKVAHRLYHEHAAHMPIFDYHCHLPPAQIASDHRFENITEIWLAGDHYKWRAMRTNGVKEELITGNAHPRDKFRAWAETVPATVGNPLYHWTHLELKRPFGIEGVQLNGETAQAVWDRTNALLETPGFTTRGILEQMQVRFICTTDDPADDLAHHAAMRADSSLRTKVVPGFRPDKALSMEDPHAFIAYMQRLGEASGTAISNLDDIKTALRARIERFHELGSRVSDHALVIPPARFVPEREVAATVKRTLAGETPSPEECEAYRAHMLVYLGRIYHELDWAFQLHIGALRNANSRMFAALGPDTGFDAIADGAISAPLAQLLDALDTTGQLPRTIIYCLNPRDNEVIATIIGAFQDGSVPGKMQFGSGWWHNDQKDGMLRQMTALANMGLLSRFVGMLTDSRSFLSYPRHEYFRRLLCDLIGGWVEAGEAPNDIVLLGAMVEDICWNNAVNYFGIDVER